MIPVKLFHFSFSFSCFLSPWWLFLSFIFCFFQIWNTCAETIFSNRCIAVVAFCGVYVCYNFIKVHVNLEIRLWPFKVNDFDGQMISWYPVLEKNPFFHSTGVYWVFTEYFLCVRDCTLWIQERKGPWSCWTYTLLGDRKNKARRVCLVNI